jgi:hypothetical protein
VAFRAKNGAAHRLRRLEAAPQNSQANGKTVRKNIQMQLNKRLAGWKKFEFNAKLRYG